MFHAPDYYRNVSLRLSDVLNDLGVDEEMVRKTRRSCLLRESIIEVTHTISHDQMSEYLLGSQCEATTTDGLHSDLDIVGCSYQVNVIQDCSEWSHDKINLLIIQDVTTPPGYCYLQCMRNDVPLPETEAVGNSFGKDVHGRVLLKNTLVDKTRYGVQQRQGPTVEFQGEQGFLDQDFVSSFPLKSWPQSVRHWLNEEQHVPWPTAGMKRYAATTDCFVVPTGSSVSEYKAFQWRISTSLAERCLIFNLSITQIRCYILLKMILKTYINSHGQKDITSYMCKTVLLHCIRSKPSYVWKESNILNCLTYCLSMLKECILCGTCPHFIIPGNNLMAGKVTAENKHRLLEQISKLIPHTAGSLLGIQIDYLAQRLLLKLDIIHDACYNMTAVFENIGKQAIKSAYMLYYTAIIIDFRYRQYLVMIKYESLETQIPYLLQTVANVVRYHTEGNSFLQKACRLLTPLFCTTLGSLMAAHNIQRNNPVCPQALRWLSAGINSDVSSGRLKFASVIYCTRDFERVSSILRGTEQLINQAVVEAVCTCSRYPLPWNTDNIEFCKSSIRYDEEVLKHIGARCVRFLPSEINCCPKELQYEMFRSTGEEIPRRTYRDAWMDLAVVDSIPYVYFLQFKTYGNLQRIQDQQQALDKLLLVLVTESEQQKLSHRETAWNLAGQCMEQQNRPDDALQCYWKSLKIRQTNNVARIHICKLMNKCWILARLIAPAR